MGSNMSMVATVISWFDLGHLRPYCQLSMDLYIAARNLNTLTGKPSNYILIRAPLGLVTVCKGTQNQQTKLKGNAGLRN